MKCNDFMNTVQILIVATANSLNCKAFIFEAFFGVARSFRYSLNIVSGFEYEIGLTYL